jgi:hypothetical protein
MPDLFKDLGIKHKGILSLSPRDTFQLLQKGAFLLDMRITDYSDYKAFDAENVLNMPPENFEERIKTLDPEGFYILADSSGINSQHYAGKMLGLWLQACGQPERRVCGMGTRWIACERGH